MQPSFPAPSVGNSVPDLAATGTITSDSNIVLATSSVGLQTIVMTTLGKSVFLPPSVTLVPGQTKFSIKNSGGYPFGVRDSSGNLLTAIAPSGYAKLSLDGNAVWGVTGTNLEPGLITIDNVFPGTLLPTILAPYVALDSNTSIHFAPLSSGFAAFVVDNTGKVVSTSVTVDITASSVPVSAFRVSSTSAIVFFGQNGNNSKCVILTLTGVVPSLSLSVGVVVNIASGGAFPSGLTVTWGGENFISEPKIAQLTPTLYLFASVSGTNTSVASIVVSGATITTSTVPANIIAANSQGTSVYVYPQTATTGIVGYASGAATPWTNNVVVISVSGVACTINTPQTVGTQVGGGTAVALISCNVSPTKLILYTDDNIATQLRAYAVTTSGVAISVGAATTIETGATGIGTGGNSFFTGGGATRYNPHSWSTSVGATNTVGLWYADTGGSVSRTMVLSEAAGVISVGQILYASISSNTSANAGFGLPFPQGTTEFSVFRLQQASTAGYWVSVASHKISNTAITWGATKPVREIPQNSTVSSVRLPTGDYCISGSVSNGCNVIGVFRNNGDFIGYRGEILAPSLQNTVMLYQQGLVSSNRIVLMGNTTHSGTTVSAVTFQLRLINVEIAS